jgi:hypothetical protein
LMSTGDEVVPLKLVKNRWYTACSSIVNECEACRSSLYCFDFTGYEVPGTIHKCQLL